MRFLFCGFTSSSRVFSIVVTAVACLTLGSLPVWAAPGGQDKTVEAGSGLVTARQLLEKAAEVQGGAEIAKNLRSFKADFETKYYKEDQGQVYYQVKRFFQFPDVLWTEKKHDSQNDPTWEVYNGIDGWFIDAEKQLTVYTEEPDTFETDIANLEDDVRITRELFRFLFIAKLSSELNDLERLGDAPVFKGRKPIHVVAGKITTKATSEKENTVYLKIYIDPETSRVNAVRMIDLNARLQNRLFTFDKHKKNKQGVLVPMQIKVFGEEEGKEEMGIFINQEEDDDDVYYPMIEFNIKIDPELVNLPEELD